MQTPTLAAHVHEIFGRGLDLYERLKRGDSADFQTEHEQLRKLLWAEGEVAVNEDYTGAITNHELAKVHFEKDRFTSVFLGVRYALACWLDDLFLLDFKGTPWEREWNANALEVEVLFGTGSQERAWRFWRQFRDFAPKRPAGTDALEVFLWCTVLGFRGEPENEGIDPIDWADRTRTHIIKTRNQRFPYEAGTNPRPEVPILTGRRQFVNMLRIGVIAVAVTAFYAGYRVLNHYADPLK